MAKFVLVPMVVWAASVAAQGLTDPNLLWERATLYRDEWGVPHVYGDDVRSMAFAFGYAQAEDHLEAMLVAYRVANGRAAEVFGEGYAASDAFAIKMGHGDLAREAYASADAVTRDLCDGFALGVNTWLVEHREKAPRWAEGVSPADVLALMHAYLMSMAPLDIPGAYRPPRGTPSANAWAVGPSLSQSGEAVLAINPHADYEGVFQWYEGHLSTGDYDVAGATLYGLPVIVQGHNGVLGWALAPNAVDFADVYVETEPRFATNPKSVTGPEIVREAAYRFQASADTKAYYVRTARGLEKRYVKRMRTARGPVIHRREGRNLSYRVGGYGDFGALRQLVDMGRAADLSEFQEALTEHGLPCFHVVYADREGNIFYLYNAKVGMKFDMGGTAPGATGAMGKQVWDGPLSASESAYEWGPIIAPDALPFLLNPESGYVQACGTPPWLATANTGMGPEDWPRWFARDADSYRAKRVRHLFSLGPRSFEDNQAMLYDVLAPFAVDAVPYLLDLAERHPDFVADAHPDLAVGLDLLREWDFLADVDSMPMTFFHVWWSALRTWNPSRLASPEELYALLQENSPAIQEHALQSASDAAKLMRNQFQSLNVPWGEVHVVRRGEREVALGGAVSGEPLYVASDQRFVDGKWPVRYGPGFAMVIRFGEKAEAVSLVPFGTSEDEASPHYDDQLDLMLERRFKVARFEREDVERHAATAVGKRVRLRSPGSSTFSIQAAAPVRASLAVSRELDSPLPPGSALFSSYMEPRVEPTHVPITIDMEIEIPAPLCAREDLVHLAVYGYHPELGWYVLSNQAFDARRGIFQARAFSPGVYAVLGPQAYLREAAPPAAPGRVAWLAEAKPAEQAPPGLEGQSPPGLDGQSPPALEGQSPPALEVEHPGAVADTAPRMVEHRRNFNRNLLKTETDSPEIEAGPPASPLVVEETIPAPVVKVEEGVGEVAVPDETEKKGRLTWSGKRPSELRETQGRRPSSFVLAADPSMASPIVVGKNLQLRPPVAGAVFHLTAQETLRAQVAVLRGPPGPLPEGTVAYTPFFAVLRAPRRIPATVALSIRVAPGLCAPEHFDTLRLYAFDDEDGWQSVQGQKASSSFQSFSALDTLVRTYAVLGPAQHLLATPPPSAN